jgi:hypothetical protein
MKAVRSTAQCTVHKSYSNKAHLQVLITGRLRSIQRNYSLCLETDNGVRKNAIYKKKER